MRPREGAEDIDMRRSDSSTIGGQPAQPPWGTSDSILTGRVPGPSLSVARPTAAVTNGAEGASVPTCISAGGAYI